MRDHLDPNIKLGGHKKPSASDISLWHIFAKEPRRYLGNVVCDGFEIFKWMEKLSTIKSLTAVPDEMFDTHPDWVENEKCLLENVVVIPFEFVEAVTVEQSFRRWLKATA